jgi:hypothetical protein
MADEAQDDGVHAVGPDGKHYLFPKGTTPDAVIAHFKAASPQSSSQSPIAPPALHPPDVGMHKSYLIGDPNADPAKAGSEDLSALTDMATSAGKSIARVSAPNIGYQMLRKRAPELGLPEGLGQTSPEEVLMTGIGAAEGAPEGGMTDAESTAASVRAPKPKTGMPEPPLEPEQQAKYTSQLDKANKDFAEDTAKYTKKVADAATERKRGFAGEPGGPQFEAEKAANRKDVLNRSSLEHTRLAQDNLQQTYKAARSDLDQRWGQFRQKMEGAELDPVETFNDIEAAKAKYLKGSPASLQVFNNLAREMGIQEFMEGEGGGLKAIPGQGKLPFDTARVHYSAIGDRLSQGNLPGNVYQALKSVGDKLDKRLTDAADTRGAGQEYSTLKSNEHQFRSDWTDSKSPLAKAYKAQDPNFLQGHLTGKGSDLLMQQLSRYRKFGAKPYLTAAARRLDAEASAIKVPKAGEPKPLGVKKPQLAEVERPVPKTGKEPPVNSRLARGVARLGGKIIGGAVGSKFGHPLIGYGVGGEVGPDLLERITKRTKMPPPPE